MDVRETLEQIERVAEAIYRHAACEPDEYERLFSIPQKLWRTDAPWDSDPNELSEHVRDDYRRMARAAIEAMGLSPTRK